MKAVRGLHIFGSGNTNFLNAMYQSAGRARMAGHTMGTGWVMSGY